MKDTIYLIPDVIPGGPPVITVRNKQGHALGHWDGSMKEVTKLVLEIWPEATIVRCNAEGYSA